MHERKSESEVLGAKWPFRGRPWLWDWKATWVSLPSELYLTVWYYTFRLMRYFGHGTHGLGHCSDLGKEWEYSTCGDGSRDQEAVEKSSDEVLAEQRWARAPSGLLLRVTLRLPTPRGRPHPFSPWNSGNAVCFPLFEPLLSFSILNSRLKKLCCASFSHNSHIVNTHVEYLDAYLFIGRKSRVKKMAKISTFRKQGS